jgi:hypothetical protein
VTRTPSFLEDLATIVALSLVLSCIAVWAIVLS